MVDLFDGYPHNQQGQGAFDEMFAGKNTPRGPYQVIHRALEKMTTEELQGRADSLADSYLAQGVTFDFAGEERPSP